ncbi:MAG: hypothetical protein JNK69_09455 [Saprospiraceae bacterium]|nr:hypothetical protein [Candidatus Vicinibacter proximus]MBL7823623.1 hypothetical protein [Saprospiraceae bacterium]MCC6842917.1 hypothetical protein [Saprospiraceae bacterium]
MTNHQLISKILNYSNKKDPVLIRKYLDRLHEIIIKLNHNKKYVTIIELLSILKNEKYVVDFDYWILVEYGLAFYELREYEKALKVSKKYMKIAPNDSYCLYNYALILRANKLHIEAINSLNQIVGKNEKIKNNTNKSIINDARYLLALSYFENNNLKMSLFFYEQHLINRQRGIQSIVTRLNAINEKKDVELMLKMNGDI